jgi:DNA invertase Pin-like site-specific DNA recombinase
MAPGLAPTGLPQDRQGTKFFLVEVLLAYLNRGDLLHDLQETARQIRQAISGGDAPARSVKTTTREGGRKRKLFNRITDEQIRELVAAFKAGTARMELAKQYCIGRTSVAKLLREWRERNAQADTG